MSVRLSGFDVVKAAAIFLVVFGHVWRGLQTAGLIPDAALFARVDDAIYLFHMPLFFFLAGLFFHPKGDFLAMLRSRIVLLLWPMVLWCWIDAGLKYAAGLQSGGQVKTLGDVVAAPFPPSGVYWFLLALFLHSLLAAALWRLPLYPRLGVMALLSLTATFGLIDVRPFDFLFPTIIYLPEYLAGVAFALLTQRGVLIDRKLIMPGLALFVFGQALLALGWKAQGLLYSELAIASATLGFLLFIANLPLPAPLGAKLAAAGRLTMPIYLTHVLFTAATRILLLRFGIDGLMPHLVLGVLAGMICPMAWVWCANRAHVSALLGFSGPKWLR